MGYSHYLCIRVKEQEYKNQLKNKEKQYVYEC